MSTALQKANAILPALIESAGENAAWRFLEFFTVNIRNRNTRAAYGQAAVAFLSWCEGRGITQIEDVKLMHVAGYIEQLQATRKAPTVKQLACIRMLFDWLVTGQVVPSNPAHAVRGPSHSVRKGSTTVMSSEDTTAFLKSLREDFSAVACVEIRNPKDFIRRWERALPNEAKGRTKHG